jgi:hypothetical protein
MHVVYVHMKVAWSVVGALVLAVLSVPGEIPCPERVVGFWMGPMRIND